MAIKRITISVREDIAKRIKKASAGQPVSTWVTELIEERLDDADLERKWETFYRDVNPGARAEAKAKKILDDLTQPARRKRRVQDDDLPPGWRGLLPRRRLCAQGT